MAVEIVVRDHRSVPHLYTLMMRHDRMASLVIRGRAELFLQDYRVEPNRGTRKLAWCGSATAEEPGSPFSVPPVRMNKSEETIGAVVELDSVLLKRRQPPNLILPEIAWVLAPVLTI